MNKIILGGYNFEWRTHETNIQYAEDIYRGIRLVLGSQDYKVARLIDLNEFTLDTYKKIEEQITDETLLDFAKMCFKNEYIKISDLNMSVVAQDYASFVTKQILVYKEDELNKFLESIK
jgi:hypothetical protein